MALSFATIRFFAVIRQTMKAPSLMRCPQKWVGVRPVLKTKIVYCKDDLRKKTYPNEKFDFLGYTFQPRRSKNRKGKYFINFSPAVSNKAAKAIRDTHSELETA